MVKYIFQYEDTEESVFIGTIENDDYEGDPIRIDGSCIIEQASVDDIFEPIRGTIMQLALVANKEKPLEDLWQNEDRYWKCTLKKDGKILFFGYITNDGLYQDFVNDTWEVFVDVQDPISYLKDLSYVDDGGLQYTGFRQIIDTIASSLARGFSNPLDRFSINSCLELNTVDGRLFEDGFIAQEIYINNDEVVNCYDVLDGVLRSLSAVITQRNGEWWIFNPRENCQFNSNEVYSIYKYNSSGTYIETISYTNRITEINSLSTINKLPIHCNENQKFGIQKHIQKTRAKHEFRFKDEIIKNPSFIGGSTASIPNWVIYSNRAIGITSGSAFIGGVQTVQESQIALESNTVKVRKGEKLTIRIKFNFVDDPTQQWMYLRLSSGGQFYYYKYERTWSGITEGWIESQEIYNYNYDDENETFLQVEGKHILTIELPEFPANGDFSIAFFQGVFGNNISPTSTTIVEEVNSTASNPLLSGEEYTVERTDKQYGKVEDVKQLALATSEYATMSNILYNSYEIPIYNYLNRDGLNYTLGRNFVINRMYAKSNNNKDFEGDCYGYIDTMNAIMIIGLEGVFSLLSYSYDTSRNITTIRCLEVNTEIYGLPIETEVVYRETIKPTIEG